MNQTLKEAWNRVVEHNYTLDDLVLILDSVKDDDHLQEFYEADERIWDESASKTAPLTKAQEEILRRKATQLLAEYEREHKVQLKHIHPRKTNRLHNFFYTAIAAAIFLCMLIPASYFYLKSKKGQTEIQLIEKVTQCGEIISFILPDSTKVTLNAGSRLLFPNSFTEDKRTVELYGEALFEVTSNPTKPFIVKNKNLNVRVLGTVFGIKSYNEDKWETVSVISGKVEVDWSNGKTLLEQNEQIKMNKKDGHFEKLIIDADKYTSWTSGSLFFNLTPIQEVINILNRYYPETEIELAEGEYTSLISGEHENESLDAVLTSIVYSTGLHCKKQSRKYTIYKK